MKTVIIISTTMKTQTKSPVVKKALMSEIKEALNKVKKGNFVF